VIHRVVRWTLRIGAVFAALIVVYLAVTLVQVWLASRRDGARVSQAIIVLGAAQYNGRPSPDLKARLDHVLLLWQRHIAPVVVVTGGKEPGDQFTEATASATYLEAHGVPDLSILREVQGRDSWESLEASARFLEQRGITNVVLVSDPFHAERLLAMSSELGMHGHSSPTRTSPIRGLDVVPYFVKETIAVAAGRIVGFSRLLDIERHLPSVPL
jgi:uncharacterized SAM-binding protein YcdF (DUF218 family)